MALIDKLKAIADGFRSARGTSNPLTLDEMAVLAAEPLGGDIDDSELDSIMQTLNDVNGEAVFDIIPDGSDITFGNGETKVPVQAPEGKAYFNDILLPKLPANTLIAYPFATILNAGAWDKYYLILSTKPYYYYTPTAKITPDYALCVNFNLLFVDVENGDWTLDNNSAYNHAINSTNYVVWTNYDMYYEDLKTVFFTGSECSETTYEAGYGPVERLDNYIVPSSDLNALGALVQTITGSQDLMTVSDMVANLTSYINS